jgi:hypothetical protein
MIGNEVAVEKNVKNRNRKKEDTELTIRRSTYHI